THDQVEAMSISDQIVIMNAGRVEQCGTPSEVYGRPASRFVAEFIGKANFASAVVAGPGVVELGGVRLGVSDLPPLAAGAAVIWLVRPEPVRLSRVEGRLQGRVRRAMFLGNVAEYLVELPGIGNWLVDGATPAEAALFQVGETVRLTPSPA